MTINNGRHGSHPDDVHADSSLASSHAHIHTHGPINAQAYIRLATSVSPKVTCIYRPVDRHMSYVRWPMRRDKPPNERRGFCFLRHIRIAPPRLVVTYYIVRGLLSLLSVAPGHCRRDSSLLPLPSTAIPFPML